MVKDERSNFLEFTPVHLLDFYVYETETHNNHGKVNIII